MSWQSDTPPKISDVARLAGVSTATVSRTLANPDLVTPETRALVLKAVDETGYVPNSAARNLRTNKTRTVLAVLPDVTNVFFTRVVRGMSETLTEAGYSLIIADTANRADRESDYAAFIAAGRVDGALLLNGHLLPLHGARRAGSAVPMVSLCERIPDAKLPRVETANRAAAHAMTAYLAGLGHRRIAYLGGPITNVLDQDRYAGYCDALRFAGLAIDPELVSHGDFSIASGEEAGRAYLAGTMPDAVFACSDTMAMGVIRALAGAGVHVPGDVSVAGFDDIEFAAAYHPALTTVRQDRARMGSVAASLLVALMEGRALDVDHVEIPADIIVRDSTRRRDA